MRGARALIRSRWLAARTYRLRFALSFVSLLASVVPLYFVANALQPMMADKIAAEGGQYFAFLIVGMVTFLLLPVSVNTLAAEVGGGINTGVLEALLGTSTRLPSIIGGMIGFNLMWTAMRAAVMLLGAAALGATIVWSQIGVSTLILTLIVLAYLPFGLIGAAMVIAFRTTGPLPQGILAVSALLGGVYYPTQVIPSWLESISTFVPLTYGLRALRKTMLEGQSLTMVASDLRLLGLFTVVLMTAGAVALVSSLAYARRVGTLSQY